MSVINQMLQDLEARRQPEGAPARYQPRARQPFWLVLLVAVTCLGALALLGWRSWLYWQARHEPLPQQQAQLQTDPSAVVAASSVATLPGAAAAVDVQPDPADEVDAVVALPVPGLQHPVAPAPVQQTEAPAIAETLPVDDELVPPPGEDPERFYARLDAQLQPERQAEEAIADEALADEAGLEVDRAAAPEPTYPPKNLLRIEQVELSAPELAALADKKASMALAKGDIPEAERQYVALLEQQPQLVAPRKQLAALLYGQGRLDEASQWLAEGVRLHPIEPDFRLLLARIAVARGQSRQALDWLAGTRPPLAQNLDYYATWAALAQELERTGESRELYLQLLHSKPDEGRWWLGLGVAEEKLGNGARALDAYRSAQLHGGLGEATLSWLTQRIDELSNG